MGIYAYRFAPVHYTDIDGMEAWLEDMAAKGLVLGQEGIYFGLTAFEKTTPKRYKYRLIASTHKYSKGRGFRGSYAPPPDEETQEFHREFGWEYIATRKDFHIYCAKDPNAPEMDTDPQIQATAIHAAAKRKHWDVLWFFLAVLIIVTFCFWSFFQFQRNVIDAVLAYRAFLFVAVTLICGIHSLYSYIRLKKLENQLLSGEKLTHRSDYRRRRLLYWISRCVEPLCWIIVIVLVAYTGYRYDHSLNAISLEHYNEPLPILTMEEILSDCELRKDRTWDNTIEKRSGFVSETYILYQQQHITLPDGTETSGTLEVTYSDTRYEWIANWTYGNNHRHSRNRDSVDLEIPGIDEAYAYNTVYSTNVCIRKDNILLTARLHLYSGALYAPEEFAQIMAESIQ